MNRKTAQFAASVFAVVLTVAACGSKTASPPSTVTVTKSASSVPSWTASAPPSAGAPSTTTPVASGPITIPDLTGQNAKIAENKLKALGLTNVELASATSKYQNVFVPANWTVVSIEPAPGTTVDAGDTVVLKVTKP
ncbi:PASTA domain-containing protein [Mycobacterium malmoense]|uniref:PASTA domain-containing protein n=1 Tax=Mycobacterium malmoense TaxID=1780 RepID=UPI00159EF01F|nr:PASTA domain-containing protein [Mycobacterium malmoense]